PTTRNPSIWMPLTTLGPLISIRAMTLIVFFINPRLLQHAQLLHRLFIFFPLSDIDPRLLRNRVNTDTLPLFLERLNEIRDIEFSSGDKLQDLWAHQVHAG